MRKYASTGTELVAMAMLSYLDLNSIEALTVNAYIHNYSPTLLYPPQQHISDTHYFTRFTCPAATKTTNKNIA